MAYSVVVSVRSAISSPKRPGERVKTNRRDAVTLARLLRATTAEVVDVDGKRVDFKVSASDGIEEIGSGTTTNLCSFNERLAKKRSY